MFGSNFDNNSSNLSTLPVRFRNIYLVFRSVISYGNFYVVVVVELLCTFVHTFYSFHPHPSLVDRRLYKRKRKEFYSVVGKSRRVQILLATAANGCAVTETKWMYTRCLKFRINYTSHTLGILHNFFVLPFRLPSRHFYESSISRLSWVENLALGSNYLENLVEDGRNGYLPIVAGFFFFVFEA